MQQAHELVFISSMLLLAGIMAGMLSTKIGAPLLLAFLGLGMAAGHNGLGLELPDTESAYLVGSAAVALILFDGGLRTPQRVFRLALGPASLLASLGVLVTATIAGIAAILFLHLDLLRGGLIGSIVSSTDAAAVFLLLHQRGRDINARIAATLETEAALNDPVAVCLTVTLVAMLGGQSAGHGPLDLLLFVVRQAGFGIAIGLAGGFLLVQMINRLPASAGLYPVMVMAGALAVFAGTQLAEGSGYLAVYLAGLVCGNIHHRSSQAIARFHDAMAWLSQLVLFIMLGLMIDIWEVLPMVPAGLGIALVLMLLARPTAIWLCLTPFRFTVPERLFVAWVGLRGAVPIFLAMIPKLAHLPMPELYFQVAFVIVLASLLLQGWTVAAAARWFRLELPGGSASGLRFDLDVGAENAREMAAWRVGAGSPALDQPFELLTLPRDAKIIAVLRDGVVMERAQLDRLQPNDVVMALAPDHTVAAADRLFSPRPKNRAAEALGDFVLAPDVPMATLIDLYGLPGSVGDRAKTAGSFVRDRLGHRAVVGDRVHLGLVDLIVRRLDGDRIDEIGVALEPEKIPFEGISLRWRARRMLRRLFRR
jgi:cell volume regulation protein A